MELISKLRQNQIILVCHSYGCLLGTMVAPKIKDKLSGIVFLAPKVVFTNLDKKRISIFKSLPFFFTRFLRFLDRFGGVNSKSVMRYLGPNASLSLKTQQLMINKHLTEQQLYWLICGLQHLNQDLCQELQVPVLILGGELDKVSPPDLNLGLCHSWIKSKSPEPTILRGVGHQLMQEEPGFVHAVMTAFLVKYCKLTYFDISFVPCPVNEKWNLKNAQKWASTKSVGELIGGLPLRAMKVLRQDDLNHSPEIFHNLYPNVVLILDLSKDSPPYDTECLSLFKIKYQKLSTLSKKVPNVEEVDEFISKLSDFLQINEGNESNDEVAVHCHYGFNRTGFMIVSFLVEVMGYLVADALDTFAKSRPNGIRHLHFKDELYLRYSLRRRVPSINK